ncbi:MAG: flagellar basal body-associated FliL family protein [Thermodesulfobacteriota bacterium]
MSEETDKNENQGFLQNRKKLVLIFSGAAVIIIVTASLLFFFLFKSGNGGGEAQKSAEEKTKNTAPGPADVYTGMVKFPEMRIDLMPESEEEVQKKIRISFYLEFKSDSDKYVMLENMDKLQNFLKIYFSRKKPSHLDTLYEKIMFKKEIFQKVREITESDSLENIYITEFLILDW